MTSLLLALLTLQPAHASRLQAERHYHDAMTAYKRQDFKAAMAGFMDAILEDPTYPGAKERLKRSAVHLLALEKEKVARERESLMFEIQKLYPERAAKLKAEEDAATSSIAAYSAAAKTWEESLEKALTLARFAPSLAEALNAYAAHLEAFPITYAMVPRFAAARAQFQSELLKTFSKFGEDPLWKGKRPGGVNTGDMGLVLLTEKLHTDKWGNTPGLYRPLPSQDESRIKEAMARLSALEQKKEQVLWLAARAYRLYKEGALPESARAWQGILREDSDNAEAKFYIEEISIKTAAASAPPAPAAPRAAAVATPRPPRAPRKTPVAPPAPKAEPAPAETVDSAPVKAASEAETTSANLPPAQERARELYDRGLRAYSTGELDEAITLWKGALELDPQHPKAKKALDRALRERR